MPRCLSRRRVRRGATEGCRQGRFRKSSALPHHPLPTWNAQRSRAFTCQSVPTLVRNRVAIAVLQLLPAVVLGRTCEWITLLRRSDHGLQALSEYMASMWLKVRTAREPMAWWPHGAVSPNGYHPREPTQASFYAPGNPIQIILRPPRAQSSLPTSPF